MTKLSPLRSRLADLRRRRQVVRWGSALAALGIAALVTLAVALAIDWTWEPSRLWRSLSLVACVVAIAWCARRLALPALGVRESEVDIALMVERRQKIDSDLVAAIQFESPDAPRWGSTQLEHAVIDYVADFSKGWNIFEGFSQRVLTRRAAGLAVIVAAWVLFAVLLPGHFAAFANRFLLGAAHYPTRTIIDSIAVNQKSIEPTSGGDVLLKSPYGQPLQFEIQVSGELPEQGRAELKSDGGLRTTVELARKPGDEPGRFVGKLPELLDSLSFELYLGDAWTDPAAVQVVPLPVVEPKLTPTLPPYAEGAALAADMTAGSRQLSVIEGSRVDVQLTCVNKRLTEATLKIDDAAYPLKAAADQEKPGRVWSLDVAGTPLERVERPLRYEIQVADEDGLRLQQPLQGFIRLKADQRPRITGRIVTRDVLPNAKPRIEYEASDDYGIGSLMVHLQTAHADGSLEEHKPLPLRELKQPLLRMRDELPCEGSYELNLAPLSLAKGDQVKVTLEVVDYRGSLDGLSAWSEPFVLQVTDDSGALAIILKLDERSIRQLDAINKRQLGIGDSK